MKNTIKAALLLSVLSANVTLSYASNVPTTGDILQVSDDMQKKVQNINKNANNFVDGNGEWGRTISSLGGSLNTIDHAKDDVSLETNTFKENVANAGERILVTADIAKNTASIEEMETKFANQLGTKKQQEKDVANNKAVMIGLQKQFSDLKNEFNEFKTGTNGGIAGISAMGLLSTPLNSNDMGISAGIGHYNGAQAVAVGLTKRINSTTVRAGASYNTGGVQPIVAAAGVGYEF